MRKERVTRDSGHAFKILAMDRTRTAAQRKLEGAHYTPRALGDFVASQIVRAAGRDVANTVTILDPACGDGSLLVSLVKALKESSEADTRIDVEGFDTSADAVGQARAALECVGVNGRVALRSEDFLDVVAPALTLQEKLFSAHASPARRYDFVIANPPYVRTQVMGAERSQRLAQIFNLAGRVDLYFAFVRAISCVLKPEGVAGIIVSNRFMTTQSGASLRESIKRDFDILSVYDFGDTRLFEAAVLPAVLILRRKSKEFESPQPHFVSIYSVRGSTQGSPADTVFDAIRVAGRYRLPPGDVFDVKKGRLDVGISHGAVWRLASDEADNFLAEVASHTAMTFGDVGPVRVGIKTTADKVFIRSDWDEMAPDEKPELLRPVITHHCAQRFRSANGRSARQVLYPHSVKDGRRVAVNLADFPKSLRYLERHRERLTARTFLLEAGRKWYEIWVPQDPEAWDLPKLVFRDIVEKPTFWIDREGAIVNGDCYWLSVDESRIELLYLAAAVGNSTFIEAFYDHRFNNKLYSGRRRFITQYVREFPLPNPKSSKAQTMIALSMKLAELPTTEDTEHLATELDDLTWRAFGLRREEAPRQPNL